MSRKKPKFWTLELCNQFLREAGRHVLMTSYGGTTKSPSEFECTDCGRPFTASWHNVRHGGTGCKSCADPQALRRRTVADVNTQLAPLQIEVVVLAPSVKEKSSLHCLVCGHEWFSKLANNLYLGHGCPKCAEYSASDRARNRTRWTPESAQAHAHPHVELLAWNGTNGKARVRCRRCGKEWQPTGKLVIGGHGCRDCANADKAMRLEDIREQLALRKIEIVEAVGNQARPWTFRCLECGHTWPAKAGHVVSGQSGCPACVHQALRLTDDEVAERLPANTEVVMRTPSTGDPWTFRCLVCGEEWSTKADNVVCSGTSCPSCADYHFDPALPAVRYLLVSQDEQLIKHGISNNFDRRLKEHCSSFGFEWKVLCVITKAGDAALHAEREMQKMLKAVGFTPEPGTWEVYRMPVDVALRAFLTSLETVGRQGDAG